MLQCEMSGIESGNETQDAADKIMTEINAFLIGLFQNGGKRGLFYTILLNLCKRNYGKKLWKEIMEREGDVYDKKINALCQSV